MPSPNHFSSRPLPSLNALRSFEATARLGSVTHAASELCVTPSAVSHQIHKLEEALNRPLINFANGKLQLSDWGAALLPGLTDGFMRIRESVDLLERKEEFSSLTVVVRPFFASHWLTPRLHRFWEAHPNIGLRMRYMLEPTENSSGRADVSIEWHPSTPPNVTSVKLIPGFLTAFCSPSIAKTDEGQAITPQDLANETFFRESHRDFWGAWLSLAGVPDLKPKHTVFLDDGTIRLQAAMEGKGFDLSVRNFLSDELDNNLLVAPFSDIQLEGHYYLVHHTNPISSKVKAFQDWLFEQINAANSPVTA